MTDAKEQILALIRETEAGNLPAEDLWDMVKGLKGEYVDQYNQQSWNSYIGNKFQGIIHAILTSYVSELKNRDPNTLRRRRSSG